MMAIPVADSGLIALATFAALGGVLSAYAVRVALLGRPDEPRLASELGTPLLGRYPIEAFHWVARAAGQLLARAKMSPDALTLTSVIITAATVPFAATGHFEVAGLALMFGSACDALDGIVARQRGLASNAGELLDSVLDRYSDAFALFGLILFYAQSRWQLAVVLSALFGSMMVSYVRAKSEALGIKVPAGMIMMRRPERLAYLCAALLVAPALSKWLMPGVPDRPLTLAIIAVIGLVANASAVQLLVRARRILRASKAARS